MKDWIELHRVEGTIVHVALSHIAAIECRNMYSVVFLNGGGAQTVAESSTEIFELCRLKQESGVVK